MLDNTIDTIIENLFYILPVIHKKLLKIEPQAPETHNNPSRLQVGVMLVLSEKPSLSISEIAQKLLIPRPQMTRLINFLVASGITEKQPDSRDKRVVKIALTEKGKATLTHYEELLKNNVRNLLSYLTENDLKELSVILDRLKYLASRLERKNI